MEKLDPKTDGSSKDILQENIDKLKDLFPEIIIEKDKVDFQVLKQILGEYVEDGEERYNFSWFGKSQARRIAQTPSTGTLRPCKEESKDWDTTQNLFIEGDNLEVLKLLQKSYHKKIKMIYIDPPYNTGKEFIYPDNYKENLNTYLNYTGQIDSEGYKFSSNTEKSGRYHTNWLNMMYPRLKLARNLLRPDGAIFISIDDNECSNLRKLCDEIFGEDNFIASVIWEKKYAPQNDAKYFSDNHDYILIYSKNKENWRPNLLPRSKKANSRYKNPDNDPRGDWKSTDYSRKAVLKHTIYNITLPSGRVVSPPEGRSWLKDREGFDELVKDNRIWFGPEGDNVPSLKRFLREVKDGTTPLTIWKYNDVGHNQTATQELKKMFGTSAFFDTPKPVSLIQRIIYLSTGYDDLILDFFAGSCTTAEAVFKVNSEDNKSRKFVMVQLPEPYKENSEAYKSGYKTIADFGKERIKRSVENLSDKKNDKNTKIKIDTGFKAFKLDSSNIKPWSANTENLEESLLESVNNIKKERKEEDVLYELLIKYGLDLTLPIDEFEISGKKVYSIGMGALVICLDSDITIDVVEEIGKLKEELDPEIMRVVFKDSGFENDVVKTNAIQILKKFNIEDVKSL